MRRQMQAGAACSGRPDRAASLEPASLPVRYMQDGQPGRARTQVYLDRGQVIMKRSLAEKVVMTVCVPVSAYRGVAARIVPAEGGSGFSAIVQLLHEDAALTLSLHSGEDVDELIAAWHAWGEVFSLPLIVFDEMGRAREAVPGETIDAAAPQPRRRGANAVARRPRFLVRRKVGRAGAQAVHRAEREIIAPE